MSADISRTDCPINVARPAGAGGLDIYAVAPRTRELVLVESDSRMNVAKGYAVQARCEVRVFRRGRHVATVTADGVDVPLK